MKKVAVVLFWFVVAALFVAAVLRVFYGTPEERTMGVIQKTFYIHMPVAINALLSCIVVFVGSIGYLLSRKSWWDDVAMSAAKVAVVLCSGVLLTGMIWAHEAWTINGQHIWWTWQSWRLTFSFMLWLLYVVYTLVRASINNPQRRALVAAVYGVVAFLDVPLVYLSARLLPETHHPASPPMEPSMWATLGICFVPVTLMVAGLIVARYHLARRERVAGDAARVEADASIEGLSPSGGVA